MQNVRSWITLFRLLGFITGALITYQVQHISRALAFGYSNSRLTDRLGALLFGIIVLVIAIILLRRFFNASFYHGFLVATGIFLSFDIVVFHWIFKLHRITSGQEANYIEPVFVSCGFILVWYGFRRELVTRK